MSAFGRRPTYLGDRMVKDINVVKGNASVRQSSDCDIVAHDRCKQLVASAGATLNTSTMLLVRATASLSLLSISPCEVIPRPSIDRIQ